MASKVLNTAFKLFFEGDFQGYRDTIFDKYQKEGLDEHGRLTEHYTRNMLANFRISGSAGKELKRLFEKSPGQLSNCHREIFLRAHLISDRDYLTEIAERKVIALQPIVYQLEALNLDHDEFTISKPKRNQLELVIAEQYQAEAVRVVFDEGALLRSSVRTFYYASRRYLDRFAWPGGSGKRLNSLDGTQQYQNLSELMRPLDYLYNTFEFLSIVFCISWDELLILRDTVRRLVLFTIHKIPMPDFLEDFDYHNRNHADMGDRNSLISRSFSDDVKTLVDLHGEKLFRKICEAMVSGEFGTYGGWPDLTILDQKRLRFIEVKAPGDSLSYDQIKQIQSIQRCFPSQAANVSIAKINYR